MSLANRLLVLALGWIGGLLLVTALVLSAYNKTLVEQGFDRRLQVYIKLLIADIANAVDDSNVVIGNNLGEPLFGLPQSGWYWQVTRTDGGRNSVRASRSLWDGRLESLMQNTTTDGIGRMREGYINGPAGQRLRAVERTVELGDDGEYSVIIAGNADDITAGLERFRFLLFSTLSLLGAGLVLATLFQVRVGLRPLARLARALAAIRKGEADHLDGRFPAEVAPLVGELNALIDHNTQVVERARTHVGNLAHALKTPLSVLQNEADGSRSTLAAKVSEQTNLMRQQVNHHLERARLAARVQHVTAIIDVFEVAEALVRTMRKINRDRDLTIKLEAEKGVQFRGERHDLEEMLGNLIDNACKWADKTVNVTLVTSGSVPTQRSFFALIIEDDGPGLSDEQRRELGQRGKRLDETKPGTGLGLSIVLELSALYGGSVAFEHSELGGLKVVLTLPRINS